MTFRYMNLPSLNQHHITQKPLW
ncbi:uncharacterized protein METZ01_LOCUS399130, partial [marine metagenome]